MIKNVIKRDNRRRKFNIAKVYTAIENAFKSINEKYTEENMNNYLSFAKYRNNDLTKIGCDVPNRIV